MVQIYVMKIRLVVLFVCVALVSAQAQQSEVRSLGSFQSVKSSEAIDVYLKKGDKESVKVEVTGIELSDIVTEVSGTTLKIHIRDGNWDRHGRRTVKAYVTYKSISKLSANSASNIFAEGSIQATSLGIYVSSAGSVEVTADAGAITIDASSAGKVVLGGKTKSLEVETSSAGTIDAYDLECEQVVASASSGGTAKVSVTKELQAQASSGGDIRYRGNPMKTNTNATSGGSVKKTN